MRDRPQLMEERERRLASLDRALERGLADIEAGRVHDLEDVFDALDAELAGPADQRTV